MNATWQVVKLAARTAIPFAVAAAALAPVACGGKSGTVSAGSGDCGADQCAPPVLTLLPEGATLPPTVEDEVAALPILEQATATIDAAGGRLSLPGGLLVVVPAGAMPAGATLQAFHHAFTAAPAGVADAIYRFVVSVEPTAAVAVTFPVPPVAGDATTLDTHNVYTLWFHGQDQSAVAGTLDAAAATITVTTTQFSTAVVANEADLTVAAPTARTLLRLPYYYQGDTGYCWSASLSMLLAGYGSSIDKPWFNAATFGVKSEDGLDFSAFAYGSRLEGYASGALGGHVPIKRHSFWYPKLQKNRIRDYLIRNITERKPTLVQCNAYPVNGPGGGAAHMIVVVGYEPDPPLEYFYVHNPSGKPYEKIEWSKLSEYISNELKQGTVVFAVDEPLPEATKSASVLVPFSTNLGQGVGFGKRPASGGWDRTSIGLFSWFIEASGTYGLVQSSAMQPAELEPDFRGGVAVAVADYRDPEAADVSVVAYDVGYEVFDATLNRVFQSPKQQVMLAAGETKDLYEIVPLKQAATAKSIGMSKAGAYQLTTFIEKGGVRQDQAAVPITVKGPGGKACVDLLTAAGVSTPWTMLYNGTWSGTVSGKSSTSFSLASSFSVDADILDAPGRCADVSVGDFPFDPGGISCLTNFQCPYSAAELAAGGTTDLTLPLDTGTATPSCFMACPDPGAPGYAYVDIASGKLDATFSDDCRSVTITASASGGSAEYGACTWQSTFQGTLRAN